MTKYKKMGWRKVEPEMAKEYACWLVAQSMQPLDEAIKVANRRIDGVQITADDYVAYLERTKEEN